MSVNQEDAIKSIVLRAKTLGIPSLLVGFKPNPKNVVVRFENIGMGDAVTVLLAGLHQAVEIELKNHPEYKDEYKQILAVFIAEIDEATRRCNERTQSFFKANKK